jgi:hypothetical protein
MRFVSRGVWRRYFSRSAVKPFGVNEASFPRAPQRNAFFQAGILYSSVR